MNEFEMKWIPYNDYGLPPKGGSFLVTLSNGWVGVISYDYETKEWDEHNHKVRAWMHLPDEYKDN